MLLHYNCVLSKFSLKAIGFCFPWTLFQSVQDLKAILYMSSTVQNYKFPLGTQANPAMTCKELMDVDNIQDGEEFCHLYFGGPSNNFMHISQRDHQMFAQASPWDLTKYIYPK